MASGEPEPRINKLVRGDGQYKNTNNITLTLIQVEGPGTQAKYWGPKRVVEVWRETNQALGIAIVGGKVELSGGRHGDTVTGIFIKNVIKDSPAGRTHQLATGDRIVEVRVHSQGIITKELFQGEWSGAQLSGS